MKSMEIVSRLCMERCALRATVVIVARARRTAYRKICRGNRLDELAHEAFLVDKNRAAVAYGLTHKLDHLLSLGLHQGNPGRRSSGVRIVLSAPVGHFYQDRDEIKPFFRQ